MFFAHVLFYLVFKLQTCFWLYMFDFELFFGLFSVVFASAVVRSDSSPAVVRTSDLCRVAAVVRPVIIIKGRAMWKFKFVCCFFSCCLFARSLGGGFQPCSFGHAGLAALPLLCVF